MSTSIRGELERFVDAAAATTGHRPVLEPGATDEEIDAAEAQLGVTLGPQLRELYRASNGGATDTPLSYSELEHVVDESTTYLRAELTTGDLEADKQARQLMDTTRLVALSAPRDYWVIDPDDPDESVYLCMRFGEHLGLAGRNWLSFVSMHADLAEQGYVDFVGTSDRHLWVWRRVGDGRETTRALDADEVAAALKATYGIDTLP